MSNEMMLGISGIFLAVNVGLVITNCLLVASCIKIYTEVVKYKIFQSKKDVV